MTPLRQRMIDGLPALPRGPGTSTSRWSAGSLPTLARCAQREDVRAYLLHLRDERGITRGAFRTNHGEIRFLYSRTLDRDFPKKSVRAPRKQRLPTVLSHAEVCAILAAVRNPIHRTCFQLMYACGLCMRSAISRTPKECSALLARRQGAPRAAA
jgi:integrase/recombinase XerD